MVCFWPNRPFDFSPIFSLYMLGFGPKIHFWAETQHMAGVFGVFLVFVPWTEVQLFYFVKKASDFPSGKSDSLNACNFLIFGPSAQSSGVGYLGLRSIGVGRF